MPSHLSAAEQKQVQTVIDRARGDRTVPHSAQESIPFQRMFPDGICRVTDNYYTKTIQFQDINYQLAQQEDQTAIFEEWCSFLNFFDSSIRFELSFMNMATDASNFEKMVRIPYQKDHFNPVRTEYSTMLRRQLAQGNNGLTKTKYLTFGIEAESMKQAKPRLIHIEIDLMNNFKRLGVRAKLLNGKERLHLMHDMFHMGDHDRFNFDWKWLPESGLSVKDFIAPTGFAFPKLRTHKKKAGGIAISIRNNELYTKEWQCRISIPTQSPTYLAKTAFALFAKNYQWEHPIRSVTVRAINLFEEDCPIQYDLFTDMKSLDRQERLDAAIEQIRFRFGKDAIKNGVLFQKSKMPTERKVDLVMPTGMIG